MERIAKKLPKTLHYLSYLSVSMGFLGMIAMLYVLLKGAWDILVVPNAIPVVSPVLPGISVPGLPTLGFWHWIIAILLVALIHEASHGIYARLYNIAVTSSGFAFLGTILAAFVEPDQQQLEKTSKFKQLSVLSAGPFSNIITGILFLLIIFFLFAPLGSQLLETRGVIITDINSNLPIAETGIEAGSSIESLNGKEVIDVLMFTEILQEFKPGETVTLETETETYEVELAEQNGRTVLGVNLEAKEWILKEPYTNYSFLKPLYLWFNILFFWLFTISIGVGLFNLLPLGPVDGGKMFFILSKKITKTEKKAKTLYALVSFFCLALIIINLLPFLIKLLKWVFSPFLLLFL